MSFFKKIALLLGLSVGASSTSLYAGVCNNLSMTAIPVAVGQEGSTKAQFESNIDKLIETGKQQNEIVGGSTAVSFKLETQNHYDSLKQYTGRTAYVVSELANGKTCYFPYYNEPVEICNPTSTCRDY